MMNLGQNKGPRPTPKNLEWGTVEKMWITTGGDLGPNDVPLDFKEADAKLKELQGILENLIKRAKGHQKAITQLNQAAGAVCGQLAQISTALSELQFLAKTLDAFSEGFHTSTNGYTELKNKIEASVNVSLTTFLNDTINPARDTKEKWETSKKDLNAALTKKKQEVDNSTDAPDALKIFTLQYNVHILKLKEALRFCEASNSLIDAAWMRDFRFLGFQCQFMMECYDHYLKRYTPFFKLKAVEDGLIAELTAAKAAAAQRNKQTELNWDKSQADAYESRYDNLVEILAQTDLALLNSTLIVCSAEQEQVLSGIVKIMDAYGRVMPIIKQGITNEVAATKEAATLFRGNSTATKLMTNTTKAVGQHYLMMVKPLLDEMQTSGRSYEVDKSKMKSGEDLTTNMANLTSACQRMLDTILGGVNQCPLPFREMAQHIHFEVGKKFPGQAKRTAVGGFVFLRFFCPAVSAPASAKLFEPSQIAPDAARGFVLIGKVLQNLANGVKFGQKEAYMIDFNGFIEKNLPRVEAYLDQMATLPEHPEPFNLCTVQDAKFIHLPVLHKKLVENMELIIKSLKSYKMNALIFPFVQVLGELGEVDVEIKPAPKDLPTKKEGGAFGAVGAFFG